MGRHSTAHVERAVQMHVDDVRPIRPTHAVEDTVAQDAGVVDQDVDAAKGIERGLNNPFRVLRLGDGQRRNHRLAAGGLDLLHHRLRRASVGAGTVEVRADVVDDHARAFRRQQHRNAATDAAPRAGDDRNFTRNNALGCHVPHPPPRPATAGTDSHGGL